MLQNVQFWLILKSCQYKINLNFEFLVSNCHFFLICVQNIFVLICSQFKINVKYFFWLFWLIKKYETVIAWKSVAWKCIHIYLLGSVFLVISPGKQRVSYTLQLSTIFFFISVTQLLSKLRRKLQWPLLASAVVFPRWWLPLIELLVARGDAIFGAELTQAR